MEQKKRLQSINTQNKHSSISTTNSNDKKDNSTTTKTTTTTTSNNPFGNVQLKKTGSSVLSSINNGNGNSINKATTMITTPGKLNPLVTKNPFSTTTNKLAPTKSSTSTGSTAALPPNNKFITTTKTKLSQSQSQSQSPQLPTKTQTTNITTAIASNTASKNKPTSSSSWSSLPKKNDTTTTKIVDSTTTTKANSVYTKPKPISTTSAKLKTTSTTTATTTKPFSTISNKKASVGKITSTTIFQGFAPSTTIESYSTDKLCKTGKTCTTINSASTTNKNDNDTILHVDNTSPGKTTTDKEDCNDTSSLWMKGIEMKFDTTTANNNNNDTNTIKLKKECIQYIQRIQDSNGIPIIRRLSIRDNDILSILIRSIHNDPSINTINIQNDVRFLNLCPSLLLTFVDCLRTNIHITHLSMIGLQLGNDFLSILSNSIIDNFTIVSINLSNNSFTNDALVDFSTSLQYNTTLTTVNLVNQQSPIFTLRENLVIESVTKNYTITNYQIEFQTKERTNDIQTILNRNKQNSVPPISQEEYCIKLTNFLQKEAELCEKRYNQRKIMATAKVINDTDMPYLYELSELAQQYKLPYETTTNDTTILSSVSTSFVLSPSNNNNNTKSTNTKNTLSNIHKALLTSDGKFLTNEYISHHLKYNENDTSLTFEYTNEYKLFKRFTITDPDRQFIVQKFVQTLLQHPQCNTITHIHMSNTLLGNDFLVSLRDQIVLSNTNNKPVLQKLHLINLETNYITGPGVSAFAECIQYLPYLQAIKLDNQKQLISSDAETDLANALCISTSVIKVSLRVRTLLERRNINNYLVRNIDYLRQARRWHCLQNGTLKHRERNRIEKLFDQISNNDSSITDVSIVCDQVFLTLSTDEIVKVASSFAFNTYVTKIKLSGIRLDDTFAYELCKSLQTNSTIEKLDLESNCIGSDGIVAIIKSLSSCNRTITELLVRHQAKPMTSIDEEQIPKLIQNNDTIIKLSIDLRSTGARDSVDKIIRMNQEKKRKSISPNKKDASANNTTPVKRSRIQLLFDKITANDPDITEVTIVNDPVFICLNEIELIKVAKSFASNTYVTTIKMSGLKLNDTFAIQLAQSLITNNTIIKLDLERNNIGTEGLSTLLQTLQINNITTDNTESTNSSSRTSTIEELYVRYQCKSLSSVDEEKIPLYIKNNTTLCKLSIDIRSIGARTAIDKIVRLNHENKRKRERT